MFFLYHASAPKKPSEMTQSLPKIEVGRYTNSAVRVYALNGLSHHIDLRACSSTHAHMFMHVRYHEQQK